MILKTDKFYQDETQLCGSFHDANQVSASEPRYMGSPNHVSGVILPLSTCRHGGEWLMSVHMWEGGGRHVRWVSPAAVHTWDSSGLQVPHTIPLLYLLLILSDIRLLLFSLLYALKLPIMPFFFFQLFFCNFNIHVFFLIFHEALTVVLILLILFSLT